MVICLLLHEMEPKVLLSIFSLSCDIRSERSIAIAKIFNFEFVDFDYISLPHSKIMWFRKRVCLCMCELTDLIQIIYLGFSCKYLEFFLFLFSFSITPKIKGNSHMEKIKIGTRFCKE